MTRAKVLIVEDEQLVALSIQAKLKRIGYEPCGITSDYQSTIQVIEREKPDLILMDIELNGILDGIDISGKLIERFNIPIIFISSIRDPKKARKAIKTSSTGYLTKPVDEFQLSMSIESSLEQHQKFSNLTKHTLNHLFVRDDKGQIKILFSDILWVEADRSYCIIHTEIKLYTLSMSLSAVSKKLDYFKFLRIHKSYLVNQQHIERLDKGKLIISSTSLPIGRIYSKKVRQSLNIF